MSVVRQVSFAAAALLLAGCKVGPTYVRPAAPQLAAYKESPPASFADAGAWNKAQPADQAIRPNWWEAFGDLQLNALEEQVAANNQDLKQAEARFREARARVGINRAAEYPTVSVVPGVESLRSSRFAPYFNSTRSTGDFTLPLDASYEIDLWGRIARSVAAAGATAQAIAADLQTATLSMQAELALDYFDLRSADSQRKLLDDSVKAYADALRLTQNRVEGGAAPESDMAQAKTQLDTTRVQATDIGVQRAEYEHVIAVLMGQPPASFSLPPEPLTLRQPVIPIGVPSELLQRRPDIAGAERRVASANEQIGIARAAYYPSLTLSGSTGFTGTNVSNWFGWPSILWAVGLSMSETLFDGGRRRATSEVALANYDATVAAYRQATLTAFQQVEDTLSGLRILEQEAQQQDEAVASAQNSLRLFTNRYVGGSDTYLQVIIAQTVALTNERNRTDILRRRMETSVLLIKSLGGGWSAGSLPGDADLKQSGGMPTH